MALVHGDDGIGSDLNDSLEPGPREGEGLGGIGG